MQTQQVQNGIASLFQMTKGTSVKQTTGSNFDDLLQTSKLSSQTQQSDRESSNVNVESETTTKVQKTETKDSVIGQQKENPKMQDMNKMEEPTDMELSDKELAEKVAILFSQITETIQEVLGLSEEELQSFMEQMGITEVDLLNANTLQNLVLLVKEQEPVMLLTDAELFSDVQDLIKQVETLLEQTGIAKEDIVNFMEQSEFAQLVAEEEQLLENTEEMVEQPEIETTNNSSNSAIQIKETTIEFQTVIDEVKSSEQGQDNKGTLTGENSFADQFLQNLQQVAEEVSETSGETNVASQIREIADQILEKIKITVTPEITSFDMVLTPEELGRVNLTIIEQDGVMKASFVTENELAKEAIESNLVQFKEMLNEQGLKVDSIEVTVGSFEFNNNGQAETGQEEQKRGKRRFNAEDTVIAGKEEDQLAQHFMEGGESTVNYMA